MILLKSPEELALMRRAGAIVAETLSLMRETLRPGITTAELDAVADEYIAKAGATPSFKGYRGFPASICASPNNMIVHGIPDETTLKEGDIISLDVGAIYQGFHGDSACTFPVGEVDGVAKGLLDITERALEAAIRACKPGARTGDIGWAVQELVEDAGYSVVREYAGHGIGRSLHEDPQVTNLGPPGRRDVLKPGMTLAIEPMVNVGGAGTKVLEDGWAVVTADGSLSAHFEHTVAITDEGCEVLTRRDP